MYIFIVCLCLKGYSGQKQNKRHLLKAFGSSFKLCEAQGPIGGPPILLKGSRL